MATYHINLCIVWISFLPAYNLSFNFINSFSFCRPEVFNFNKIQLTIFFFYLSYICCIQEVCCCMKTYIDNVYTNWHDCDLRKLFLKQLQLDLASRQYFANPFFLLLSSRSHIGLHFTCKSMIHFGQIFVEDVKSVCCV